MSDQEISELENLFPAVSGQAFADARERVLASGQSVLQSRDGMIYEVFPDGRREPVKAIAPPLLDDSRNPVSAPVPRLRMFAGPNGSGKSTLKSFLPPALIGIYLNPDGKEVAMKRWT